MGGRFVAYETVEKTQTLHDSDFLKGKHTDEFGKAAGFHGSTKTHANTASRLETNYCSLQIVGKFGFIHFTEIVATCSVFLDH